MNIVTPPAVVAEFSAVLPNGDKITNAGWVLIERQVNLAGATDALMAFRCERATEIKNRIMFMTHAIMDAFPGAKVSHELTLAFMRIEPKPKPEWK